MNALELIRRRISADHYDPNRTVSDSEIRALMEAATQSPSSYNIQHWRFIAVTRPADRRRLMGVAYNQPKVAAAPCVFIVLGDAQGHEHLPEITRRAVASGVIEQRTADSWIEGANRMYSDPRRARDEAIRSASMAAMTLMLAAEARDMVTGPMIGFDPDGVCREFGIPERYIPVMLLCLGYRGVGNTPRKPRLGVDEVLRMHKFSAF